MGLFGAHMHIKKIFLAATQAPRTRRQWRLFHCLFDMHARFSPIRLTLLADALATTFPLYAQEAFCRPMGCQTDLACKWDFVQGLIWHLSLVKNPRTLLGVRFPGPLGVPGRQAVDINSFVIPYTWCPLTSDSS